jgi:hypothetical protein
MSEHRDMPPSFVHYSPEVERLDPTFEDTLRTVVETTRR